MRKHSCTGGGGLTHTHTQAKHTRIPARTHAAFRTAPQGHCAVSVACGSKETELIDILAIRDPDGVDRKNYSVSSQPRPRR